MAKGRMSKIIMVSCRIAEGNIGKGRIPKGRTAKDWMEHSIGQDFFNHCEEYKADADVFLVFRRSTHRKVLHNNVCDV
jgi:hypothetical protein